MSVSRPEDRLTQQERENFLEDFIREVNTEIDNLLDGHNYLAEIKGLRFRIGLLERQQSPDFAVRLELLRQELRDLEDQFEKIRPRLEALEEERRFYRAQKGHY
ncbi:MAG TPA: hypothetical protein VEI97_07440 [bacterium]|nr:hypothetical protein [bacterium]